jgi:ParB family chromosome partitioning protein
MSKKRGLGRGLDALLGAGAPEPGSPQEHDHLKELPVELIRPGKYQPRTGMDAAKLEELADSIRAQGIVQPIVVRPVEPKGDTRYEIIAGERRWRAAQKAGMREIPAVIREIPDEAAVAMALIENIQREELNPLEEAGALERLIEEFSMTHESAARAVGRSRASVSNLLRLNQLEVPVKKLLGERELDMGHARALLSLAGLQQAEAAAEVAKRGLSVRATEQMVRKILREANEPATDPKSQPRDPNIEKLESDLGDKLGARVAFQHKPSGKGRMVVHYNSLDELDGILAHIK